jgi:hypothetical protein
LSLERLQKEGFIDLDNPLFPCRLMVCHGFQETVTPQESGVLGDPTASCGLPDGEPVNKSLSVILPAFSLTQSGHGRLGQY